jgi:hypothetical protein
MRLGTLERFLAACGRPAWETARDDVDRVVAGLAAQGWPLPPGGYVQAFKGFHAFRLRARRRRLRRCSGSAGRSGG